MAEMIPGQVEHFVASGLEFGYAYDSPLIDTATEGPCPDGDVSFYRPTTHPGARLPHAFVRDETGNVQPLHNLIQTVGLTLFTAEPLKWKTAMPPSLSHVPITVTTIDPPSTESRSAVLDLLEIGECGAVVVRPDGHVVWRTRTGLDAIDQFEAFMLKAWAPLSKIRTEAGRNQTCRHQEQS